MSVEASGFYTISLPFRIYKKIAEAEPRKATEMVSVIVESLTGYREEFEVAIRMRRDFPIFIFVSKSRNVYILGNRFSPNLRIDEFHES